MWLIGVAGMAGASGLPGAVQRNTAVCGEQGWTGGQVERSLVFLNLAGGDCVDDLASAALGKRRVRRSTRKASMILARNSAKYVRPFGTLMPLFQSASLSLGQLV